MAPQEGAGTTAPIPLNAEQERAAKEWAADDRLWTTQETVEFNLRTFARMILKLARAAHQERTEPQSFPSDWADAVNSAKGLCESEANRWATASPGTSDHWRSVAIRLGALWLAHDLLQVGAPARAAEWQPLACPFCNEQEFDAIGLKIHFVRGHCEAYEAVTDSLPPCALTGTSDKV